MDTPTMLGCRSAAPDTEAVVSYFPIPFHGILPINAFRIRAAQPVLVDTGRGSLNEPFMENLRSRIALGELRWIWLTHTDADHMGNLAAVLREAPRTRVVTTFPGMGKMTLHQLPVERVYLLNPGQSLDVGDRRLVGVKPPTFDAPETTGVFDAKTCALFSADCFGALMGKPSDSAAEIAPSHLKKGLETWATIDAPWLHAVNPRTFASSLETIRKLDPAVILSSHPPPAAGMNETLLRQMSDM